MVPVTLGTNLGPTQMARHLRDEYTAEQLSHINRRHMTSEKLDAALRDVINRFNRCTLPRCWGDEKRAAADGTQYDLVEENLVAEQHIRYGGFGGIAYHYVSDLYIALLLRKLTNYSRKNRLYQAFRELGCVIRTMFLLQYISDVKLREIIHATTNKVEPFHSFSKWIHFGGEGKIAEHTPEEMEKHIKYKDLLANCLVLHNTVEISNVLNGMAQEGFVLTKEDLAALSPYQTQHIKRFGNYEVDLNKLPQAMTDDLTFELDL